VSFYLAVWHADTPIERDDAQLHYQRICLGPSDAAAVHPALGAFLDELTSMPATLVSAEVIGSNEASWNAHVHRNGYGASIQIMWPQSRDAAATIRALAERHGLVVFDPQSGVVMPNAPGYLAAFTLSTADGQVIPDPNADRVERAARRLNRDAFFLILSRADGWWVQAAIGENAGARPGQYALEYQEGSLDRQYRAETTDLNYVIRFLTEFLAGQDTWKRRHSWRHLEL
jgi:hypothetical protein